MLPAHLSILLVASSSFKNNSIAVYLFSIVVARHLLPFLQSYFAGAICLLDMKPIYARELKKIEQIIADMEALQD